MRTPLAKPVYSAAAAGAAPFMLRLLSPLAEGSDRLVAEQALKAGYRLYAPLPFAKSEYEKDFPDTLDAREERLLARERTGVQLRVLLSVLAGQGRMVIRRR